MTTVTSRHELRHQRAHYILVINEDQVYVRCDDEYIPKAYFSVHEVMDIMGVNANKVHVWCRKLGIQAHANKRKKLRITLKQLRQMAEL